jgi:hypothetical protein
VDLVIFDMVRVSEAGKVVGRIDEVLPTDCPFTLADEHGVLLVNPSACNKLFRRRLFLEHTIRFPAGTWFEDMATVPMLYPLARSIRYVREPLYRYLQRSGSIMRNRNNARNGEILDALERVLVFYRDSGLLETYRRELEFVAVHHGYITASVRVLLADPGNALLARLREYLQARFPDYRSNSYLPRLDSNKRLVYALLNARRYRTIWALFKLKGILGK